MRKLFYFLVLIIPINLFAQHNFEKENSEEKIDKAVNAFEKNDTVLAFKLINGIHENDSLYLTSILTKTSFYFNLEQYNKVVEICNSKDFFGEKNYSMELYKGVSLLRLEKIKESIDHFQGMLKLYPKSYLVNYNLGIAYKNNEELDKAISFFQESIILYPYYAPPHLELAKICYQEDLISQAILCYDTYLLLNPTGENSLQALSTLDEIVASKNEMEPLNIKISDDDDAFEEIDLLIRNYTALNKNYKIPNKFEVPLVKQNHVLFELLNEFEGNNGFWDTKYVKFYKKLFNEGYFNDLIYYIMSSTTNEKYKKIIEKNNKNEDAFVKWVAGEWMSIVSKNNNTKNVYNYLGSGKVESLGGLNKLGEYNGERYYYEENGRIRTHAYYLKNERDGHWEWFYNNGIKEEEIDYKNGVANGPFKKYYENGNLKLKANYSDDNYNGELNKYNKYGVITEQSFYINDSLNGITTLYHDLGQEYKRLIIPYEKNLINGIVKEFYADGKEKLKISFENGERVDEEISFYNNGEVLKKYSYENGMLNGDFFEYYSDGVKYSEGIFKNDYRVGEWKLYYNTGELLSVSNYNDEGMLNGLYKEYNRDGKKTIEYLYKDGDIIEYQFFDKEGNVLTNSKIEKGKLQLKGKYINGNVMVNGEYIDGSRDGDWFFYSKYGSLMSKETYKDELLNNDEEYFIDGKISDITKYENGQRSDFISYYINGTIASEGYYKNDMLDGFWYFYYPDGNLSDKLYYSQNNLEGYQYDYAVNGKLYSRDTYENGRLISTLYYDTSGVEFDTIEYFKDTNGFLLYPNGNKRIKYNCLNGKYHGNYESYHFNGKINAKGQYFNNKPHGYWVWFNDKGAKTSEGNYFNGDKIGVWYRYTDEGIIKSEINYQNGYLHGDYQTYNEDGKPKYKANYVYGKAHGASQFYSENGELQLVRYYNFDELIGYSYLNESNELIPMIGINKGTVDIKSYYPNGNLARELTLLNGEFNGFYKKYHSNGQLSSKEYHIAGIQDGESISYFEDGSLYIKSYYVNGSLHGDYVEYYKNGNIKEKLVFINDELSGPCVYYNEDGSVSKKIVYYNGLEYEGEYY